VERDVAAFVDTAVTMIGLRVGLGCAPKEVVTGEGQYNELPRELW
jgi:hypothetical protein